MGTCEIPLLRVIPFATDMRKELTEALDALSVPLKSPSMHFAIGRRPLTLEIRHALSLHQKLVKQQKSNKQTKTKGRYSEQVCGLFTQTRTLFVLGGDA